MHLFLVRSFSLQGVIDSEACGLLPSPFCLSYLHLDMRTVLDVQNYLSVTISKGYMFSLRNLVMEQW